jgi:hypothetical protein
VVVHSLSGKNEKRVGRKEMKGENEETKKTRF